MLLYLFLFTLTCCTAYYQRIKIRTVLAAYILEWAGFEIDRIRKESRLSTTMSEAKIEGRRFVVEFAYDGKVCKFVLPFDRRLLSNDSRVGFVGTQGEVEWIHYPPGLKFYPKPSELRLGEIIRIDALTQEQRSYSGPAEVN